MIFQRKHDVPDFQQEAGDKPDSDGDATGEMSELLDIVWPGSGLATASRIPDVPKNDLTNEQAVELQLDFVSLSLSPTEFIQLAAFMRVSVDRILAAHPHLQHAVNDTYDTTSTLPPPPES